MKNAESNHATTDNALLRKNQVRRICLVCYFYGLLIAYCIISFFSQIFVEVLVESHSFIRDLGIIIICMFILILPTSLILYWDFTMRWEYKDGGKNAVADFWKKYWSWKVPRLVDIRVEQLSLDSYLRQLGKYPENLTAGELGDLYLKFKGEFGDDRYAIFDFYRGIMYVDVYVYVPLRAFMKLGENFRREKYSVIKRGKRKILRYEDFRGVYTHAV